MNLRSQPVKLATWVNAGALGLLASGALLSACSDRQGPTNPDPNFRSRELVPASPSTAG